MISPVALIATVALLGSTEVLGQTRTCWSRYRGYYQCSGLATGARIGIGIGVAVGVLVLLALCGFARRRYVKFVCQSAMADRLASFSRMQSRFSNVKPPALPYNNANGQSDNPYANNPPPPSNSYSYGQQQHPGMNSNQNSYAPPPTAPPQTYQPSMSQNYTGNTASGPEGHEHGYEWQQAREEEERLRREGGGEAPPPGYTAPCK